MAQELLRSEAYREVVDLAVMGMLEGFAAELESLDVVEMSKVFIAKGAIMALKNLRIGIQELAEYKEDEDGEA